MVEVHTSEVKVHTSAIFLQPNNRLQSFLPARAAASSLLSESASWHRGDKSRSYRWV
jgi:hypothetical protein